MVVFGVVCNIGATYFHSRAIQSALTAFSKCHEQVPNVKNVQDMSVAGIAAELIRLQQAAAANRVSSADLADGTLTVSNIGSIGGSYATPLLSGAEVAIVALGRYVAAIVFMLAHSALTLCNGHGLCWQGTIIRFPRQVQLP